MAEAGDLSDISGSLALKILQELNIQGKITPENFEQYTKMYHRIHETQVRSFQNQKVLPSKLKKMQAEIKVMKEHYDQQVQKNEEAEIVVKLQQGEVKKTELEEDALKKTIDQILMNLEKHKTQLAELDTKIQDEIREKHSSINPMIEEENRNLEKLKDERSKKKQQVEQQQKLQNELLDKKQSNRVQLKDIREEIEHLQQEVAQIKDEPVRVQKKADMLQTANGMMQNDLSAKLEEISKKDKDLNALQQKKSQRDSKIKEIVAQIELEEKESAKLDKERREVISECKKKRNKYEELCEERVTIDHELRFEEARVRELGDRINSLKKEIDNRKKQYKREQQQREQIMDQTREFEISIDKYQKEESEIKFEIAKQEDIKQNISDEAKLTEFKKRTVENKTAEKDDRKQKLDKQIQELEKQLERLQEFEVEAMKKVKMLTAMRESMARKASSAMAEVRETREELKIKELLILDLTKKHQETEFKLNSFKALYEEVKSARNKYVNLIQNASQDLAELKERIKILQNELEILKNESSEKDSTLMQYKHILQLEIHKRDRAHARLNQREYQRRAKKEQVDQNINEIEKLNMIIMALEKEMLLLRKNYEQACESRNYTGIQLIDRNDELCILYEKSNIQENILRNGEQEIKKMEDEIRMIKIEINEKQRQIDVARKQILLVPKLADKVIELKNQLELEQTKERTLSEELENPENLKRWRELKGEDADQEALEAKIHVLEERLNNKKEQLLEKELILDEITNLSEKLRKQALEGRQSTLELSEKLNDFQARLKEITRKMMASISELSMFQATAIKLQQERDELEKVVDEATKRTEENLPPTPQSEIEYLKMVRDRKRYEEERQLRLQREALEKNFPPFATKTTAEHRVNAYIPDEIGIPKPYSKNAPFKPSPIGANFRHYRKPLLKDVEV